jgi:hypothetical protein
VLVIEEAGGSLEAHFLTTVGPNFVPSWSSIILFARNPASTSISMRKQNCSHAVVLLLLGRYSKAPAGSKQSIFCALNDEDIAVAGQLLALYVPSK